mmetsp:Transcript_46056/g.131462  ORF Transcript_46056/g.131462 Transcript_46056/m.131462 type:complete len:395 (-) Transcript_46056:391-1575(-)
MQSRLHLWFFAAVCLLPPAGGKGAACSHAGGERHCGRYAQGAGKATSASAASTGHWCRGATTRGAASRDDGPGFGGATAATTHDCSSGPPAAGERCRLWCGAAATKGPGRRAAAGGHGGAATAGDCSSAAPTRPTSGGTAGRGWRGLARDEHGARAGHCCGLHAGDQCSVLGRHKHGGSRIRRKRCTRVCGIRARDWRGAHACHKRAGTGAPDSHGSYNARHGHTTAPTGFTSTTSTYTSTKHGHGTSCAHRRGHSVPACHRANPGVTCCGDFASSSCWACGYSGASASRCRGCAAAANCRICAASAYWWCCTTPTPTDNPTAPTFDGTICNSHDTCTASVCNGSAMGPYNGRCCASTRRRSCSFSSGHSTRCNSCACCGSFAAATGNGGHCMA